MSGCFSGAKKVKVKNLMLVLITDIRVLSCSSISDSLTRLSGQPEHHDRARILMTLLRKQKQDMEVALQTSTYMNGNPSSNGQS